MLILAIRLAAELAGLVALGYWGASTQTELPARIGLWLAAPAALAIVWAVWQSKRETKEMREASQQLDAATA